MLKLSKGYLKDFHLSGDNNIQSGTPVDRSPRIAHLAVVLPASGQAGVGEESVVAMAAPMQEAATQEVWE